MSCNLESSGYSVGAFESADEFLRTDHVHGTACLILDVDVFEAWLAELFDALFSTRH